MIGADPCHKIAPQNGPPAADTSDGRRARTEVDKSIDAIVTTVSRAFYETNVRSARLYGARVTY